MAFVFLLLSLSFCSVTVRHPFSFAGGCPDFVLGPFSYFTYDVWEISPYSGLQLLTIHWWPTNLYPQLILRSRSLYSIAWWTTLLRLPSAVPIHYVHSWIHYLPHTPVLSFRSTFPYPPSLRRLSSMFTWHPSKWDVYYSGQELPLGLSPPQLWVAQGQRLTLDVRAGSEFIT